MKSRLVIRVLNTGCWIALFIFISCIIEAEEWKELNKQIKILQKEPLLDEILDKMDQKYKTITTMQVDFEQTKNMLLLAQPVTSEGVLIYKRPDQLLWKFHNPTPTVMILKGGQLTIHYPDIKQADVLDIEKYKDRAAKYLGLSDSMMKLKRYYDIRVIEEGQTTYMLELIPKRRRIKQKIDILNIWLSTETYLPTKIFYKEPNGDTTLVKISNTQINIDIDPAVFDYKLPEGTKINSQVEEKGYKFKKELEKVDEE